MDPYNTLGIQSSASPDEVKKAYRAKALEHHPDKGGDEEKFKEVTEAYEILTGKRQGAQQPAGPLDPAFASRMQDFMDQINRQTANRWQKHRPPRNDSDIVMDFRLSVEDMKSGGEYDVTYSKSVDCKECNGVGGKSKTTCVQCKGRGQVIVTQSGSGIHFSTPMPCPSCKGLGSDIVDPCQPCEAQGWTVVKENLTFRVGVKK